MAKVDYMIQNGDEQILIEVETKRFAKGIVDQLVAERKRLGYTQQDIADLTGMKAPNVTRIESCKYTPSLEVLMRYAKALGKKIEFELVDEVA